MMTAACVRHRIVAVVMAYQFWDGIDLHAADVGVYDVFTGIECNGCCVINNLTRFCSTGRHVICLLPTVQWMFLEPAPDQLGRGGEVMLLMFNNIVWIVSHAW